MGKVLRIDRSIPFNPAEFLGKGWGIEEQDERSLALLEVDLSKVGLRHMLRAGESWITGEERLKRLKVAGDVRLDAKIPQTLLKNPKMIPPSWKEKMNAYTTYIFFDGTVLCTPDGYRGASCLYWDGGCWRWDCRWHGTYWGSDGPSAVVAG